MKRDKGDANLKHNNRFTFTLLVLSCAAVRLAV